MLKKIMFWQRLFLSREKKAGNVPGVLWPIWLEACSRGNKVTTAKPRGREAENE